MGLPYECANVRDRSRGSKAGSGIVTIQKKKIIRTTSSVLRTATAFALCAFLCS